MNLFAVFPEVVSCLTETRFLLLGTLASLTVMACFPERETLRRSFNFVFPPFVSIPIRKGTFGNIFFTFFIYSQNVNI